MLLRVDNISIKGPRISEYGWWILGSSFLSLEIQNIFIVDGVVDGTVRPVHSPLGNVSVVGETARNLGWWLVITLKTNQQVMLGSNPSMERSKVLVTMMMMMLSLNSFAIAESHQQNNPK